MGSTPTLLNRNCVGNLFLEWWFGWLVAGYGDEVVGFSDWGGDELLFKTAYNANNVYLSAEQ